MGKLEGGLLHSKHKVVKVTIKTGAQHGATMNEAKVFVIKHEEGKRICQKYIEKDGK